LVYGGQVELASQLEGAIATDLHAEWTRCSVQQSDRGQVASTDTLS
jgi:hypothetical protein